MKRIWKLEKKSKWPVKKCPYLVNSKWPVKKCPYLVNSK